MNLNEIMVKLESMGSPRTRQIWLNNGAEEPLFGVKIGDFQKIVKHIKTNHALALELFNTGNLDAMYLACLVADEKKVTLALLEDWVSKARWHLIGEYALAGLAAESTHGWECGLTWIQSDQDHVSAAGWATLSACLSLKEDKELDLKRIRLLLDHVARALPKSPNRTRFAMNNYIVSVATYVGGMLAPARDTAQKVGQVMVTMGAAPCKVPLAIQTIDKLTHTRLIGKKKKRARA